jgi:hypothetical protein
MRLAEKLDWKRLTMQSTFQSFQKLLFKIYLKFSIYTSQLRVSYS